MLLLGGAVVAAGSSSAQFRTPADGVRVEAERPANLFASWQGTQPTDRLLLNLPAGWTLRNAVALRYGSAAVPLAVERVAGEPGQVVLAPAQPLREPATLVFTVTPGPQLGEVVWTLRPLARVETKAERDEWRVLAAHTFAEPVRVVAPGPVTDNRAWAAEAAPVVLDREALPPLGTQQPHTIEFWLRSTALDEVVLSSWDGRDRQPYPFEITVGPDGRLFVYRGLGGEHDALAAPRPVADGAWHHVAYRHDPAAGWTHLFLDGRAVDSLYAPALPAVQPEAVVLGGRAGEPPTRGAFSGLLDEVRFWGEAVAGEDLHRMHLRALPNEPGRRVVLSFDEPLPRTLLQDRRTPRLRRVPTDLAFRQTLDHIRPRVEGGTLRLAWEALPSQTETFIVERSDDAQTFLELDRIPAAMGVQQGDRARYEVGDPDPGDGVAYYRIRQRFTDGAEYVSPTVKVGLGDLAPPPVALVSVFPNPFQEATTIAYRVREAQDLRLSVWDLSGQQVAQLVNERTAPGYYEARFQATDLPSGTYFVRLQAEAGTTSRKMTLTK